MLKAFNLIGPPAILFFNTGDKELSRYRIIGYVGAEDFLKIVSAAFQPSPQES